MIHIFIIKLVNCTCAITRPKRSMTNYSADLNAR